MRRIALIACLSTLALGASEQPQPQHLVIDGLTDVYGWYDESSGVLTTLSPSGFAAAHVAKNRLRDQGALTPDQLKAALNLRQDQLAAYVKAYEAGEPRRQEERAKREEAAKQEADARQQREEAAREQAEALAATREQQRQEQAAESERRQKLQIDATKAQADQDQAQALQRLADAAMAQAIATQQATQIPPMPTTPPPAGLRWQFVRSPQDPNGHWLAVP